MSLLRSALPAALLLSLVGVAHAEYPFADYSSGNTQGKLTVAISGACSGKTELTPAFSANYGWAYSVTDGTGPNNKKPGTNKTSNGGMGLHDQTAGLTLSFPDFAEQYGEGEYAYSYGGNIYAGTNVSNKTVFSVANKGSTETFKLSGPADISIEKVIYQMYEQGKISCKGDFDFAELMPRYEYDDFDLPNMPTFDLRGNTSKHTLSLTHTGSETGNKFTVKYTGQIELDVANVCTGTAQNGNWHPSDNFALKSLSCKGGAPVKVKISFDGSGNSQQQIR